MATLTTNISSVSLTVSGTTTQSTTISWTCPSVPVGSTINSCTLTGTATASMSKGNATIKVNGTTVSSGSAFTINLGTSNTTSSVTATAVGGNKNAAGTVTFSNLVYTVNYTEPVVTYTVTFKDWDGTVLKTESVGVGGSATAPEVNRYGYILTGWSVDFTNVTSDIITIAQYAIINLLHIKENGNWISMDRVFKKISGVWIEQTNDKWPTLFNTSIYYKQRNIPIPTAILYEDGTFIFSPNNYIDNSHGNIVATYIGWDSNDYLLAEIPWADYLQTNIQNVYFNNITTLSTNYWFANSTLKSVYCSGLTTTDMESMFYGCSSLTSLDVSNFDTSNVTTMYSIFYDCSSLTSLDVSNFNTSKVTNMRSMFNNCSSLASLDLSNFDTSNVTNMYTMFNNCSSLASLDLSNFNTSNVTDMKSMFHNCSLLASLDVSNFNTSNVTDMKSMFYNCSLLASLDVSNFNTSNVTDMSYMFYSCSSLTSLDVNNFDTSKVTRMYAMFYDCSSLTSLDVSNFDTSNVTDMCYMFWGCSSLASLDLSNFDISNVAEMDYMFCGCSSLTSLDLSTWDMSDRRSSTISNAFADCTNPNLIIYVKDDTAKTLIESSYDFPSTATVVIGSPNN